MAVRCFCCAHGPLLLLPTVVSFLAMVLTWVFTFDCRFYELSGMQPYILLQQPQQSHSNLWDKDTLTVGLWTVEDYSDMGWGTTTVCHGWNGLHILDKSDLDGAMQFARFTSMLAALSSLFVYIFLLFAYCMPFNRRARQILAGFLFALGLLCLLTLSALNSSLCKNAPDCQIAADGKMCIVSFLLWTIAGISVLYLKDGSQIPLPPPTTMVMEGQVLTPGKQEVVETVNNPDGSMTTTTTTTTTHPDGSQTITRTVVETAPPTPAIVMAEAQVYNDK